MPLSGGVSGRGFGGATPKDPRLDLDRRINGQPVPAVSSSDDPPGVADEIGTTEGRVGLYSLFRPLAQGFGALQFRPQMTVAGYPNFEHNPSMPASRYYQDERTRPQTVVMRAWGAQRSGEGDWAYVEAPDNARARGGTGDGGVLFHPPRFELEDYYGIGNAGLDVTDTTSAQATTSFVLVAPGVKHAYGLPNPDGTLQPGGASTTYGGATKPLVTSIHTSTGTLTAFEVDYDSAAAEVVVGFGQNQALKIPAGTTAQRPSSVSPAVGMIRYNTTSSSVEVYNGSAWEDVGGGATGDITTSGLTMTTQRLLGNASAGGSTGAIQELVLDSDDFNLAIGGGIPTLQIVSIGTGKIDDAAVTTAKIADAAVTVAKIADANVTTVKIADANVTEAKLADGAIATAKLASSSVTGAKILDGTIGGAKLDGSDGLTATGKTYVDTTVSNTQTNIISYYSLGIPSRPPITCAGINASGNLTIAGTVDGRDVARDGGYLDDVQTLTGVSAGSVNLGTFTGTTIADNETVKGALQDLETELESRPYVLDRQRGNPYVSQSTTTLTEYYSVDIPGGALDNKSLRIFMHGTWRNFSGASQNNQLAVYINGTSYHVNANDVNNDTDKAVWRAEIELSKSATNTLFLSGQWRMSTQNTNIGGWGYLARDGVIGKDGISESTSVDMTISLRQRWQTSTTNSDFKVYAITTELV